MAILVDQSDLEATAIARWQHRYNLLIEVMKIIRDYGNSDTHCKPSTAPRCAKLASATLAILDEED
jgi:hypothetical protein